MKIHNVLGSQTKVFILRVLISNYAAYSLYDLRSMTFSSLGALHNSIKDLLHEHIIKEVQGKGKQKFYKINRDAIEIINLFEKEKSYYQPVPVHVWNYLSDFTNYCKKNPNIMRIYLLGSFARGEQRPDSDIDILIVSKRKMNLEHLQRKNTSLKLQLINLTNEDFNNHQKNKTNFINELNRGNIGLFER